LFSHQVRVETVEIFLFVARTRPIGLREDTQRGVRDRLKEGAAEAVKYRGRSPFQLPSRSSNHDGRSTLSRATRNANPAASRRLARDAHHSECDCGCWSAPGTRAFRWMEGCWKDSRLGSWVFRRPMGCRGAEGSNCGVHAGAQPLMPGTDRGANTRSGAATLGKGAEIEAAVQM
jgi:hypothetical protein